MSRRFAILWLRCAIALFTGSFVAIELAMAIVDSSIRQHTTGQGFLLVIALHLAACAGIGFVLTRALDSIDRRTPRKVDVTNFDSEPQPPADETFTPFVFGRPGWPREKGQHLALLVLHGSRDDNALDACASLMGRESWEYGPEHGREFSRGFLGEVAHHAAEYQALRASVAARLPAAELRELLRRIFRGGASR